MQFLAVDLSFFFLLCIFQVVSCVDISQSAYSQLQSVNKVSDENSRVSAYGTFDEGGHAYNASWQPKPKRMLKMILNDGFHTVTAIENRPIPQLPDVLEPGNKLTLRSGPIEVRRGLLMLTEKNVKFHGGFVEELQNGGRATVLKGILEGIRDNGGQQQDNLRPRVYKQKSKDILLKDNRIVQQIPKKEPLTGGGSNKNRRQAQQRMVLGEKSNAREQNRTRTSEALDDADDSFFASLEIPSSSDSLAVTSTSNSSVFDVEDDEIFSQMAMPSPASTSGAKKKRRF